MSKIISPYFNYYRNEAHYQYMVVYREKIIIFSPVMSLVQSFVPEFDNLLDRESRLVDAQKKSPYTAQIIEADILDDRLVLGMKETVTGATKHYDPSIAAAAVRLDDRIKAFGRIESKSYEEGAAALSILINDLQSPAFINDVNIVNIEGWIRELDSSLNNFKNLLRLRNESVAVALPKENLKTIRKEIDGVYNKMITRINAAAELDETGTYEPFIQQINAEILYFNEHTHRKARKDLGKGDHTVIEPIPVQQHTGMPITPIPSVIYREEGKQAVTLTFAEDFTLSYKNNINVGMAEIIVRGKGHYKGKIITTFNIEFEN